MEKPKNDTSSNGTGNAPARTKETVSKTKLKPVAGFAKEIKESYHVVVDNVPAKIRITKTLSKVCNCPRSILINLRRALQCQDPVQTLEALHPDHYRLPVA